MHARNGKIVHSSGLHKGKLSMYKIDPQENYKLAAIRKEAAKRRGLKTSSVDGARGLWYCGHGMDEC